MSKAAAHTTPPRSAGPPAARCGPTWDLELIAGWRSAAYRIFATLLLPPDVQRLRWLGDLAGELRANDDDLAAFGFFTPWQRLLERVEQLTDEDAGPLQAEHVRLFVIDPGGTPVFPYESAYVAPRGQDTAWLSVQLTQTYRRSGLSLAPSLNENPDHVAVELEFMAFLCGREADSWARRAPDQVLEILGQQRLFLRLHLASWFGTFARRVRASTCQPLYAQVAEAAEAFIHHDRDLADALLTQVQQLSSQARSLSGPDHQATEQPR
jgi:putative dimethyl sulfoxide reductase chaperone